MNTKPDEYYIKQTLSGNVNAFAILVERYKNMVYTLSIKIVKNKEEAEEISQDAFVKAYKSLKNFKGESKFSTWVYKIAYNASLDAIKRNNRFSNIENIDDIKVGNLSDIKGALEYLEEKERKKVIGDALLKLNEDERTILTLFYFEELSIKDIAKVVNLLEDNIKVKLYRSRKKLAVILKHVVEPRTIELR